MQFSYQFIQGKRIATYSIKPIIFVHYFTLLNIKAINYEKYHKLKTSLTIQKKMKNLQLKKLPPIRITGRFNLKKQRSLCKTCISVLSNSSVTFMYYVYIICTLLIHVYNKRFNRCDKVFPLYPKITRNNFFLRKVIEQISLGDWCISILVFNNDYKLPDLMQTARI